MGGRVGARGRNDDETAAQRDEYGNVQRVYSRTAVLSHREVQIQEEVIALFV